MATKTRHNHDLLPFGAYVDEGVCPRCDQLRAEKLALGETPHNHATLPFGRRKPRGECPRCTELLDGAPTRESDTARQARLDAERSAAINAHTNETCPYMTRNAHGHWVGVCVCFDW
jgi:hypothetical protein